MIGFSVLDLATATLAALVSYWAMKTALRLARNAASRLASQGAMHSAGQAAGIIAEILGGTSRWLMVLTALLIGVGTLQLAEPWTSRVSHLWFLTVMLQAALWANGAITLALSGYFERHAGQGGQAAASSTLLSWGLRTLLWTVAVLAILPIRGPSADDQPETDA